MMEQDAVHIGYEADVTAHHLDTNGKKIGVTGLLNTGAVQSVTSIKTLERLGFTWDYQILTILRFHPVKKPSEFLELVENIKLMPVIEYLTTTTT